MPYSRVAIGDFAATGSNLRFVCRDCGASVVAPIDQVARRFGLGAQVGEVQAHAVCRQCNSIEVIVVPAALVAV